MYAYGNELLMRSVLLVSLEPLPFGRRCRHQAGPASSDLGEGVLQLQLEPAAHLDPQPGLDCGFARPAYPAEPTSGRAPTVTLLICKGIALPGDRPVRRAAAAGPGGRGRAARARGTSLTCSGPARAAAGLPDELLHLSLRERVIPVSAGMLQCNQCWSDSRTNAVAMATPGDRYPLLIK